MRVLNVGGHSKSISIPTQYDGMEHVLLDIDPLVNPDVLWDARRLTELEPGQYDCVYSSHNLEHFTLDEVPEVLRGCLHVLKNGGIMQVRVPDILAVMQTVVEKGMDLTDTLYESGLGPIRVIDVLYGLPLEKLADTSQRHWFMHKTGFSLKTLAHALIGAGFTAVYGGCCNWEVNVMAVKGQMDPALAAIFLPGA